MKREMPVRLSTKITNTVAKLIRAEIRPRKGNESSHRRAEKSAIPLINISAFMQKPVGNEWLKMLGLGPWDGSILNVYLYTQI